MIRILTAFIVWFLLPISANAIEILIKGSDTKFISEKVATLDGEVDVKTWRTFRKQMRDTSRLNGDRIIIINSSGGIVDYGLKMIELIRAEKISKTKVVCFVDKSAISMAFNILSHCDVRIANENAILLFHKIRIGGVIEMTAKQLREKADDMDRRDEPFVSLNSKLLSMTREEYDAFAEKDTNWKATTLFIRGYLHHIGEIKKTP